MKKNCHICLIGAFLLGTLFGWVVNELFCGAPEDNRRDRGVRAEIMMRQQMESRMKKGAEASNAIISSSSVFTRGLISTIAQSCATNISYIFVIIPKNDFKAAPLNPKALPRFLFWNPNSPAFGSTETLWIFSGVL